MFYRIVERSLDEETSQPYVLAHYWESKADFDLGAPPVYEHAHRWGVGVVWEYDAIITDRDGHWKTLAGSFVDPGTLDNDAPEPEWEREHVVVDQVAEIERSVIKGWESYLAGVRSDGDKTMSRSDLSAKAEFDAIRTMPESREI